MTTTSTRPGIRTALGYRVTVRLAKPIEPTRPAVDCQTCAEGCECDGAAGDLSCGHYGCWGRERKHGDLAMRCRDADTLHEHMHAMTQYRRELHSYDMQSHLR